MKRFEQRLCEAMEPVPAPVDIGAFLRFAGAIATSSQPDKVPAALERAATLPPAQLAAIIGQVEYNGDLMGLKNAVANKPQFAVTLAELARKVMPEAAVSKIIALLAPAGGYSAAGGEEETEHEIDPDTGEPYEDRDDEDDEGDGEDDYDQDADYYSQGADIHTC